MKSDNQNQDTPSGDCLVIANNRSGSFFSQTKLRRALSKIPIRDSGDVPVVFPKSRGDAIDYAYRAAVNGAKQIFVWGGDGSINAVLNGVIRAKHEGIPTPTLVLLGGGSGSDFMRTLKRRKAPSKLLVDAGLAEIDDVLEPQFFMNGFSFGVTAEIAKLKDVMPRWLPGPLKYLISTFVRLAQGKLHRSAEIDAVLHKSILGAIFLNGQFVGGGMRLLIDTSIQDGVFEKITLPKMKIISILKLILSVYTTGIRRQEDVQIDNMTENVSVSFGLATECETDGEVFLASKVKISVIKQAIEVQTFT